MKDGFLRVGICSPSLSVADPKHNADTIIDAIRQALAGGVRLLVFPELAMTGYTCGDLFMHSILLDAVETELIRIMDETKDLDIVAIIGAPLRASVKLYNCAVVMAHGKIIGITSKAHLPNYGEFYERRHFSVQNGDATELIRCEGLDCTIDGYSIYQCAEMPQFRFGVELCEDLWIPDAPSSRLAQAGALIIANCSAGDETIGKADYRRNLVSSQSAKTISAYIYCNAGEGESTSDLVFSGHSLIYENGYLLAERKPFEKGLLFTEIDLGRLEYERRRVSTYPSSDAQCRTMHMFRLFADDNVVLPKTELSRSISRNPFVPNSTNELNERARDIIKIQAMGLKKRIQHVRAHSLVLGISGGLDSSLALIIAVETVDMLGYDRKFIHAVTMPCFGTTEHTKNNAVALCEALGVALHTIPITESVRQHFRDIGHDENNHNVVFENGQARMRTLVLMDMANALNGLVIGTGDLSELALGWATYNGDHMSMYGVNAGVPKTLIKYLVRYYANTCNDARIKDVLISVLDTPISPELLPADESDNITQKTEDLVGPYELHDFFLYYVLRWGYPPNKLYRIAKQAFAGSEFSDETILKWLKNFYRRFFTQQFKRNCLPDGPKVGSVCLSPRGDWRMPSDASYRIWQDELNEL